MGRRASRRRVYRNRHGLQNGRHCRAYKGNPPLSSHFIQPFHQWSTCTITRQMILPDKVLLDDWIRSSMMPTWEGLDAEQVSRMRLYYAAQVITAYRHFQLISEATLAEVVAYRQLFALAPGQEQIPIPCDTVFVLFATSYTPDDGRAPFCIPPNKGGVNGARIWCYTLLWADLLRDG